MKPLKVLSIKYLALPVTSLSLNLVLDIEVSDGRKFLKAIDLEHLLNAVEAKPLKERIKDTLQEDLKGWFIIDDMSIITESQRLV